MKTKKSAVNTIAIQKFGFFSIVDIIGILTDQPSVQRSRNYWKVLKTRLIKEGNELVTNCNQLKLHSEDGKFYKTDVALLDLFNKQRYVDCL